MTHIVTVYMAAMLQPHCCLYSTSAGKQMCSHDLIKWFSAQARRVLHSVVIMTLT